MKRIAEEQEKEESPMRYFTLHKYNLKQLQEAYKEYVGARHGIIHGSKNFKRYKKMKDKETVHISEH